MVRLETILRARKEPGGDSKIEVAFEAYRRGQYEECDRLLATVLEDGVGGGPAVAQTLGAARLLLELCALKRALENAASGFEVLSNQRTGVETVARGLTEKVRSFAASL